VRDPRIASVGVVFDHEQPAAGPDREPDRPQRRIAVFDEMQGVRREHAIERPIRDPIGEVEFADLQLGLRVSMSN